MHVVHVVHTVELLRGAACCACSSYHRRRGCIEDLQRLCIEACALLPGFCFVENQRSALSAYNADVDGLDSLLSRHRGGGLVETACGYCAVLLIRLMGGTCSWQQQLPLCTLFLVCPCMCAVVASSS